MLQINDLNKKFYKQDVLCDLSYTFEKGHIYSILGANGSGRTTLFECISGDISYDSGEINTEGDIRVMLSSKRESFPMYLTGYQFIKLLRNEPVKKVHVYQENGEELAEVIGGESTDYDVDSEPNSGIESELDSEPKPESEADYVSEDASEADHFEMETGLEIDSEAESTMFDEAGQKSEEQDDDKDYDEIDQILALVRFDPKKKHLLIKDYDSKTKKKLQLAANLVKRPDVMMFDETFDYTDEKFMQEYIQILESISDEHIILVSTGVLDVAESVPGDIVLLNNGKLNLLERDSLEDEEVLKSVIKMLEEDEDE